MPSPASFPPVAQATRPRKTHSRPSPLRHAGGASLLEYLMLVGLCALAAIIGFKHFGSSIQSKVREQGVTVRTLDGENGSVSSLLTQQQRGRTYLPVIQPQCFAAGTLVATESGDRPIESVRDGDRVWSRDETTGTVERKPVLATFVTYEQEVIALDLDAPGATERIEATPGHRFWSEGRGWTRADELGDAPLFSPEGPLQAHPLASLGSRVTVYNLEIADDHSYFVGRRHAWVHNADPANSNDPAGCGREAVTYGGVPVTTVKRTGSDLSVTDTKTGALLGVGSKDANGYLELAIYTKEANSDVRGGQVYQDIVNGFKANGDVTGVRGLWGGDSDNLTSFNDLIRQGMTPEEAAAQTFTGKMAARSGYPSAEIDYSRSVRNPDGTFQKVEVWFSPTGVAAPQH